MNNEQNEEAIEAFKKLNSPYASFYQAMVSKCCISLELDHFYNDVLFFVFVLCTHF